MPGNQKLSLPTKSSSPRPWAGPRKGSWLAAGAAIPWLCTACLAGPEALNVLSASLGTRQSWELTAGVWEGLQVPASS